MDVVARRKTGESYTTQEDDVVPYRSTRHDQRLYLYRTSIDAFEIGDAWWLGGNDLTYHIILLACSFG